MPYRTMRDALNDDQSHHIGRVGLVRYILYKSLEESYLFRFISHWGQARWPEGRLA